MSTAYHPHADGQSQRMIQALEDMLQLGGYAYEWQISLQFDVLQRRDFPLVN